MKINGFDNSIQTERLICGAIGAGKFPHASIIEGGSAAERLDLARRIAAALICENGEERPCGVCAHCVKARHSSHPDIMFIEPRKKSSSAKEPRYDVEYIRDEIIPGLYVKPNESDYKILVFTQCEKIFTEGQNALLKTIEEPPRYAVFIFLCESKNVFLPTILSRSVVYNIGQSAAESAGNSESAEQAAVNTALAVTGKNEFDIIAAAAVFDRDQQLFADSLPFMEEIFGEALRIKFGAAPEIKYPDCSAKLAADLPKSSLLRLIDACEELIRSRRYNANLNLSIVRLCALFRAAAKEQE